MPSRPVNSRLVSWFGKLPAYGDFIGRRMAHSFQGEWDYWVRSGLDQLRSDEPDQWVERYTLSPLWNFMCSSSFSGQSICGVIAPSMDRVGRFFPISVIAIADGAGESFVDDTVLLDFFAGASAAVIDARRLTMGAEDFEQRLVALPWPMQGAAAAGSAAAPANSIANILSDLGFTGNPLTSMRYAMPTIDWRQALSQAQQNSVWWVSPNVQHPRQEFLHHGPLHRAMFARLFQGVRR